MQASTCSNRCRPSRWAYHLIAIAIVAIWGVTFISTKVLIEAGLAPHEIFLLRFVVAYAGIWTLSHRRLWCASWRDEAWLVAGGMTGGSIYFLTENTALQLTLASNVSFIVCTAPLLTTLLVVLVDRRRGSSALWGGSLLAMVGVALVVFNGHFVLKVSPLGDLLSLAAAFSWAVYSLIIRRMSGRYPTAFLTRKVFFYGILTVLPFFVLHPWAFPLAGFARTEVWFNLFFLSVVASLGCYATWNVVLRRLGTVQASNYIYLNPIFTLAASSVWLGERLTWLSLTGVVCILLGVYWAGREPNGAS